MRRQNRGSGKKKKQHPILKKVAAKVRRVVQYWMDRLQNVTTRPSFSCRLTLESTCRVVHPVQCREDMLKEKKDPFSLIFSGPCLYSQLLPDRRARTNGGVIKKRVTEPGADETWGGRRKVAKKRMITFTSFLSELIDKIECKIEHGRRYRSLKGPMGGEGYLGEKNL